jgi:hypothetical protein
MRRSRYSSRIARWSMTGPSSSARTTRKPSRSTRGLRSFRDGLDLCWRIQGLRHGPGKLEQLFLAFRRRVDHSQQLFAHWRCLHENPPSTSTGSGPTESAQLRPYHTQSLLARPRRSDRRRAAGRSAASGRSAARRLAVRGRLVRRLTFNRRPHPSGAFFRRGRFCRKIDGRPVRRYSLHRNYDRR